MQRVGKRTAIPEAIGQLGQALKQNETRDLSSDGDASLPFHSGHFLPVPGRQLHYWRAGRPQLHSHEIQKKCRSAHASFMKLVVI